MVHNTITEEFISALQEVETFGNIPNILSDTFGVKAASLNNAPELAKWIPPGFLVSKSLVAKLSLSIAHREEIAKLNEQFNELFAGGDSSLIVRSSSTLEWVAGSSFAGLYLSTRGINSFKKLLKAIRDSYISSHHKTLKEYAKLKSLVLPEEHLAILVQKEIKVKYCALIVIDDKSEFIEYFEGDIVNSVQGQAHPSKTINKINGELVGETISPNVTIPGKIELEVSRLIATIRKKLNPYQTLHLEVGSDGDRVFLFQINYQEYRLNHYLPSFAKIELENKIPQKAAAMESFKRLNLFSQDLQIYNGLSYSNLCAAITKDFSFQKGVTIRYSSRDEISLPRGFFRDKEQAKEWIKTTYKSADDWYVIVHSYIEVRRSYELLLDTSEFLLEHIPGMWESDNNFNPDVLYSSDSITKAWLFSDCRTPLKGIFGANLSNYEQPITQEEIEKWQLRLTQYTSALRNEYANYLPLNFHFVEDQNGDWNFLNIRKGFSLSTPEMMQSSTHIIRNKEDVLKWDGKKPLQMQLLSERGKENEIIETIKLLPKNTGQVIVVDFGLLSHPAIILREFGYKLIPKYLYNPDHKYSPNYLTIEIDRGLDPVNRIMKEKPLYEDDDVKVVADKDQIVDGHLLMLSKKPFTSLVEMSKLDCKISPILERLKKSNFCGDSLIVERGRARFCTSGFTDSHAHAHIFPKSSFKENSGKLFVERIKAERMPTMLDAIKKAKASDNEYLMLIDNDKEVYLRILPDNISMEKQLIRKFFKEHSID